MTPVAQRLRRRRQIIIATIVPPRPAAGSGTATADVTEPWPLLSQSTVREPAL